MKAGKAMVKNSFVSLFFVLSTSSSISEFETDADAEFKSDHLLGLDPPLLFLRMLVLVKSDAIGAGRKYGDAGRVVHASVAEDPGKTKPLLNDVDPKKRSTDSNFIFSRQAG